MNGMLYMHLHSFDYLLIDRTAGFALCLLFSRLSLLKHFHVQKEDNRVKNQDIHILENQRAFWIIGKIIVMP